MLKLVRVKVVFGGVVPVRTSEGTGVTCRAGRAAQRRVQVPVAGRSVCISSVSASRASTIIASLPNHEGCSWRSGSRGRGTALDWFVMVHPETSKFKAREDLKNSSRHWHPGASRAAEIGMRGQ